MGNGDAYAQIGYFYTLGEGVEKNDSLAFENYKKAADLKSANGALNLGVQYILGSVTAKDLKEAEKWHIKAVEYGSAEAAWRLYTIYTNGDLFPKDEVKAEEFLQKALKAKHPEACCLMGYRYYLGKSVINWLPIRDTLTLVKA